MAEKTLLSSFGGRTGIGRLELEEREYSALESRQRTNPEEYDVLVKDIHEADFKLIGDEFGVHRLQTSDTAGTFPVGGVIYGSSHRIFVPLMGRFKVVCCLIFLTEVFFF